MLVKELIELLNKYDPNIEVKAETGYGDLQIEEIKLIPTKKMTSELKIIDINYVQLSTNFISVVDTYLREFE